MPRTHYIVRYSKLALIPGTHLTYSRGEEVPASIWECRTESPEEAEKIARESRQYDGERTKITKVHRSGKTEEISFGWVGMPGFASPAEKRRLDISDMLDFIKRMSELDTSDDEDPRLTLQSVQCAAAALIEKHSGRCINEGA